MEGGIEVDGHEILKVLSIGGGKGIEGMVGGSEGIHEIGQGAREHLEEGIPNRILLAAAEGRVLEDVGDAGVVGRIRFEADGEDIVAVLSGEVEVVGARLLVFQMKGGELELGNMLCS